MDPSGFFFFFFNAILVCQYFFFFVMNKNLNKLGRNQLQMKTKNPHDEFQVRVNVTSILAKSYYFHKNIQKHSRELLQYNVLFNQ